MPSTPPPAPPPLQGEPALLPVHTDRGGHASNPAPPREAGDDYEHVSHAGGWVGGVGHLDRVL